MVRAIVVIAPHQAIFIFFGEMQVHCCVRRSQMPWPHPKQDKTGGEEPAGAERIATCNRHHFPLLLLCWQAHLEAASGDTP